MELKTTRNGEEGRKRRITTRDGRAQQGRIVGSKEIWRGEKQESNNGGTKRDARTQGLKDGRKKRKEVKAQKVKETMKEEE